MAEQLRAIEKERIHIPHADPFDEGFKRIQYVRYADDFLVGVIGSKDDAKEIKERIHAFLADTLKLELSDEKTFDYAFCKTSTLSGIQRLCKALQGYKAEL